MATVPSNTNPEKPSRLERFTNGLTSFVESPMTNLIKGISLLVIGIIDASQTFKQDLTHLRLRVGHGMALIGLFSILGVLPHFIGGLEASQRYLKKKTEKGQDPSGKDAP